MLNLINKSEIFKKFNLTLKDGIFSVFVLFFLFFWIFFITPELLKIDEDFSYRADVVSVDNFYDEAASEYRGEQYSKTEFSYEVVSEGDGILTVKNTFDVKSLDGRQIFKTEPLYGINPYTGEHVKGSGDRDREGYLFGPRGLRKGEPFTYWHVSSNVPSLMKFVDEEIIYGVKVFKYEKSNVEAYDQTEFMGFLPGVPESRGVKLASNIIMWIEPVSGYLVRIDDFSTDYYYYDIKTGEKISPYNNFLNTYSEKSIREHASIAERQKNFIIFTKYIIPFLIFVVFLIYVLTRFGITRGSKSFLKTNWLALLSAATLMLLSFTAFYFFKQNNENNIQNYFELEVADMKLLLSRRIDKYIDVLLGARGLFDASESVERDEWTAYVRSLQLDKNYPGVQGVGFSKVIIPEEKNDFIRNIINEGFPDFKIIPVEDRNFYTSIIYLEPFDDRNKRAFGYDMFSEPIRRKAMVTARDTGEPSASGRVTLLQEFGTDIQPGFLIYVPIYKDGDVPQTLQGKILNLSGYVFSPFRINDLMEGVFGDAELDLDFHIYDGLSINPDKKMFDFRHGKSEDKIYSQGIIFRKVENIYIAGYPWTIEFLNSEDFNPSMADRILPYALLILGLLISSLTFAFIHSNIKGRARAVAYAERVNKQLIENISELEKFKLAVDSTSDHVVITNADGIILYANKAVEKITGYSIGEIIGAKAGKPWGGLMGEAFYKIFWHTIKIDKKSFAGNFKNKRKNGEEYVAASVVSPIVDKDTNEVKFFIGIERDITKEKQLETAKSEFISIASHQLKTPVAGLKWTVEGLMIKDSNLTDKQRSYIKNIAEFSNRLGRVVEELLNVSRLELGTLRNEAQDVDIKRFISRAIDELRTYADSKNHKLVTVDNIGASPIAALDSKLLYNVIQNLVSNGIEYSPENTEVKIELAIKNDKVMVSISNKGPAISVEAKSHLFEKFYRAPEARKTKPDGTGIGLFVVKSFVKEFGGDIGFDSEEGKDTTFWFTIPIKK